MPRPKRERLICNPPQMQGFRPFGIPMDKIETVTLTFDEYESINLLDYKLLNQEQAAEKMNVSRPTLTRIYESARRTIANAFIEGKAIIIAGGNVYFEQDWFRCKKCFKLINGAENHIKCKGCTAFGTDELVQLNHKKDE